LAELGFDVVNEEQAAVADVTWFDGPCPPELYGKLKSFQKVNNFPASGEISRKDLLAHNMRKMAAVQPEHYNFAPKSWIIPANFSDFERHSRKEPDSSRVYIVKPVNSASKVIAHPRGHPGPTSRIAYVGRKPPPGDSWPLKVGL